MKKRVWRRALLAVVAAGAVTVASGAAAEPNPNFPNLPATYGNGWLSAGASTLGYVLPAEQWLRIPNALLVTDTNQQFFSPGPGTYARCTAAGYSSAQCTLPGDVVQRLAVDGVAYPLSVADPVVNSRFDVFPEVTLNTVAFGAIPAQVTLQVGLPHDAEGLPQPLHIKDFVNDWYWTGTGPFPDWHIDDPQREYEMYGDSTITGALTITIKRVVVDGEPVPIDAGCQASGSFSGTGHGYSSIVNDGLPLPIPDGDYIPVQGGTITGTLDVGRFHGCGANGDDLDPLLSAMGSGSGLPVTIHQPVLTTCFNPDTMSIHLDRCNPGTPLPIPSTPPSS